MHRRNKERHDRLFDGTRHLSGDAYFCNELVGAVLEQAVADYKLVWRAHLRGKKKLPHGCLVENQIRDYEWFFHYYCEGKREELDADYLIEEMRRTCNQVKRRNDELHPKRIKAKE